MLGRAYGIARSMALYHGVPGRHRKMVRLYGAFLGPGDIGFDVGAHVGSRVRAWRALGARVVAVEPQPDFARILRLFFGRDRERHDRAEGARGAAGDGPAGHLDGDADRVVAVDRLDRHGGDRPQLRQGPLGPVGARSR